MPGVGYDDRRRLASSHSAIANSQRGRNEQPAGRLPGRGGEPAIPCSSWELSMEGTARISPRVYGCAGLANSSSAAPISISLPEYRTATWSAISATTARSWLM